MTSESGKTGRRYGSQFKSIVLAQFEEPGMSVAQVAMLYGINGTVVHRWPQLARQEQSERQASPDAQPLPEQPAAFLPIAVPAPPKSRS